MRPVERARRTGPRCSDRLRWQTSILATSRRAVTSTRATSRWKGAGNMWIQASKAAAAAVIMVAALATLLPRTAQAASGSRSASQALDVTQLVQVALEVNPQVRAARARWESAEHSIKQAYAPNDPQVSYTNGDSAGDGFSRSSFHTLLISEAFQFPGKALLQGTEARRSAEIARL